MKTKMTFWGVGPKYALFSALYCSFVVALSKYTGPFFEIPFVPYYILKTTGITLIITGLPFYIISLVTIKRAYTADSLVTEGPFGICRNPVYAAWVVFFVPGIMFLLNSWIGLSAPFVMYFIILMLVKEEEEYLESVFGHEYLEYKEQVPIILPIGWFKSKKVNQ